MDLQQCMAMFVCMLTPFSFSHFHSHPHVDHFVRTRCLEFAWESAVMSKHDRPMGFVLIPLV